MKRIFSVLAVLTISLFVISCDVESRTKSLYEKSAETEIKILELDIAEAETYLEYYEYVADLNDEDFAEWVENNEDWKEEVEDEYKDKLAELEDKQKELSEEIFDIADDLDESYED